MTITITWKGFIKTISTLVLVLVLLFQQFQINVLNYNLQTAYEQQNKVNVVVATMINKLAELHNGQEKTPKQSNKTDRIKKTK